MQSELRALIRRHCTTLDGELQAVRDCLDTLEDHDVEVGAAISRGAELTHKIKGSSGTIGFPEISSAAADLEGVLKSVPGDELSDAQRKEIDRRFKALAGLITDMTPEMSTLYNVA